MGIRSTYYIKRETAEEALREAVSKMSDGDLEDALENISGSSIFQNYIIVDDDAFDEMEKEGESSILGAPLIYTPNGIY